MDLETLVRETLAEHAVDAPSADGLLERVASHRRRVAPWLAAGLSAAAVVALAVGLSLRHESADKAPVYPHAGPATSTTSTPQGYRTIAYHGALLDVPADLGVYTTPCLLPAHYVVAADPNVQYDCVGSAHAADHRTPLVVTLSTSDGAGNPGGLPPNFGYRIYPGLGITVSVQAPERDVIDTILDSVRAGTDPLGCPARLGTVSNPAEDSLVPGSPTAATRCVYSTSRDLLASYPVAAQQLTGLVAAIDALPGSPPINASGPSYESDLLRFDYADGTSRTLSVDLNDPTEFSDGNHSGYDHDSVVTDQLRAATNP